MPSYAEVLRRGSARNKRRRNNAPPPPPPPPPPPGGQQEIQSEPGYRFWPTDEEIIVHYLRKKIADPDFKSRPIPDKDVYSFDPWELYDGEQRTSRENLFFFTKTVIGGLNRAAKGGYWSMTIPDRLIKIDGVWAGMRRRFEFIKGQEQSKTSWTMHEYSVPGNVSQGEDWVVCRVFKQPAGRPASNNDGPQVRFDSYIEPAIIPSTISDNNQQQLNVAAQQHGQPQPVNRSSTHSDAPTVDSHNQLPVNTPTTLQGPPDPTGPYSYNMVNQQLPGPNMRTLNPNFMQPGSASSTDPWFYNHNQHQWDAPTTLQGPNQPGYTSWTHSDEQQRGWNPDQQQQFNMAAMQGQNQPDYRSMTDSDGRKYYSHNQQNPTMPAQQGLYPYGPAHHPASNMFSTYHYNMGNQQQPGIRPPRYLRQNVSMYPDTRVVGVGGNFNSYFPRPDDVPNSSHNQRPHIRNDNQSSVQPQGRDCDIICPDSITD